VGAETMCSGREFQIWSVATGKAQLPTVERLTGGTTRRLGSNRTQRPSIRTSAVKVSGPRYRGASPRRTIVSQSHLSPRSSEIKCFQHAFELSIAEAMCS